MKRIFLSLVVFLFLPHQAFSIPNSFFGNGNAIPIIPAFPRFNADLTEEFLEEENWKEGDFSGPWQDEPAMDGQSIRRMSANPIVMGEVPMSVYSYEYEGQVQELAIHYLDAGLFFGYKYGGEQNREEREAGKDRRSEFSGHFKDLTKLLHARLEDGCGRGTQGAIGRTDALRTVYTDYTWENFVLRLVTREDHSVSLYIMLKSNVPTSFVDEQIAQMRSRDREAFYEEKVVSNDRGDTLIQGIPMFTQGNTPFCGIHSLAMVGQYLGLRVKPEALIAGADFKNTGSAGGSDILGLYRSAAAEVGMRASVTSSFKADRVLRSLEEGLPVIVWRRVSMERENAHSKFLVSFEKDPSLTLPVPTPALMETFPAKSSRGTPSHASVVTGMNMDRSEVIFTEPWGENTRNRRMRIEEMEATAYAVFFFKL